MQLTQKAAQALWICLVETQQAIVLHLNDTGDQKYIDVLAQQHRLNNAVLRKIKGG